MKLIIDSKYEVIADWLKESLTIKNLEDHTITIIWSISFDQYNTMRGTIMSLTLTDTQKVNLEVSFVDARGNAALVDGIPTWDVSDDAILSVNIPEANPFAATVIAEGPLGNARVTVSADADLGEGIEEVIGYLDITVVAGKAVGATISAGTPEDQI